MELVSVFGICLVSLAAVILLRQHRPELALPVSLAAGAVLLVTILSRLAEGVLLLQNRVAAFGLDTSWFYIAMKALGICVITGFISDTCRDAGQNALASKAELAGRCAVFILTLPLLSSLLDMAVGFIK